MQYNFWCDEASATIVRVGKYSSQCKTKEAVSSLYKQFEKFMWPTIPQQEERINQITELAVRLHGKKVNPFGNIYCCVVDHPSPSENVTDVFF